MSETIATQTTDATGAAPGSRVEDVVGRKPYTIKMVGDIPSIHLIYGNMMVAIVCNVEWGKKLRDILNLYEANDQPKRRGSSAYASGSGWQFPLLWPRPVCDATFPNNLN